MLSITSEPNEIFLSVTTSADVKIISAISQTELQGRDVTNWANKIYDFLPGHLKNSELETIFETTLERVFSKVIGGKLERMLLERKRY